MRNSEAMAEAFGRKGLARRALMEPVTADREIDRLVYALYGLTEEEIAIVESATT